MWVYPKEYRPMGCESCSKNASGLPRGCRNNGACGVSGCDKLEVFDWLAGMQLPEHVKLFNIVEVRFKNSRKHFFRNSDELDLHIGDVVVVDASPGYDVGVVSLTGELVRVQMNRRNVKDNLEIKKVLRKASNDDISKWQEARKRENDTMMRARHIADSFQLQMKISDVEFQGDGVKATFYYTADDRVDFRELIRALADAFRVRIEMRQIGMRQEAGRLGGIGSCGRELCCSTWLTDFRSVSTSAARYQQLSLNPQKLAGQCGKLKCCLNFELDQYRDATKEFPPANTKLETEAGRAFHFKTDIFKRIMYFSLEGERGGSPVAVGLDEVLEIIEMNRRGEKPASLNDFMIVEQVEEVIFQNDVGQDSLTRFDRSRSKRGRGGRRKPKGQSGNRPSNRKSGGGNRSRKPSSSGEKPQKSGQNPNAEGPKQGGQPRKNRGGKGRRPGGGNRRKNSGGQGDRPKGEGNA